MLSTRRLSSCKEQKDKNGFYCYAIALSGSTLSHFCFVSELLIFFCFVFDKVFGNAAMSHGSGHGNLVAVVKNDCFHSELQMISMSSRQPPCFRHTFPLFVLWCRAISALTKGPTASLSSALLFRLFQDLRGTWRRSQNPFPSSPSSLPINPHLPLPLPVAGATNPCAKRLLFSPDARPPSSLGDVLSPALDLVPMAKNISNHIIAGSVCVRACVCPTFSLSKLGQARSSLGDYRTVWELHW